MSQPGYMPGCMPIKIWREGNAVIIVNPDGDSEELDLEGSPEEVAEALKRLIRAWDAA